MSDVKDLGPHQDRQCGEGKSVNPPAKKGGGGGKFTMGKAGDDDVDMVLDKGDPMYDSDNEQEHYTKSENTIFDQMARGEVAVASVFEDDQCMAINDANPQAPTHIVLFPKVKDGLTRLKYAKADHAKLLGHMMVVAGNLSRQANSDCRIIINDGKSAGQTVNTFHIHILGGRAMSWPPG